MRSLGHDVVGVGAPLDAVGHATAVELPDVALVIVGEDSDESLELIRSIVHEAACPVMAILDVAGSRVHRPRPPGSASSPTIAHTDDREEMQSSMDISLQRFAEYHALEGAFGRRAVTERAKGILMERHALDEQQAFRLLREHARRTNRKVVDVAASILESHQLLSRGAEPTTIDAEILTRTEEDA